MGVIIPQVVTSDRASGAQVIDGSLKFVDGSSQQLTKTFSSAGNRRTNTFSCWIKKSGVQLENIFSASSGTGTNHNFMRFNSGKIEFYMNETSEGSKVPAVQHRDIGWYHLVFIIDTTNSTADDRMRIYVNNVRLAPPLTTFDTNNNPSENYEGYFGSNVKHTIGSKHNDSQYYDGQMSQVYFIDGQALEPENFGFTDPLTNTWRPKKFSGSFTSDYTGVFAPYSAAARLSTFVSVGTVEENATGYTLPMGQPVHYGGKVLNGGSGGFYIETTNSATEDFFMGCWIKVDTLVPGNQMAIDITGGYKYFELRSGGVIGIRHIGGTRADSSATSVADGNWHHIALSRVGSTLYGFVDGTAVVTTTSGVSGNTISANEQFNFFGDPNASSGYNLDGQLIDSFVYIGQGQSSNFSVPTAPLVDNSGSINHYSGFSDSQLYYASPLVTVSGSTPNPLVNFVGTNGFHLPFDGQSLIGEDKSGLGNNFTPVNFNNAVKLDSSLVTGARPILNTTHGGFQAGVGVFGSNEGANLRTYVTVDPSTGNNVYSIFDGYPYGSGGYFKQTTLNFIRGATYIFDQSMSSNGSGIGHPLRLSSTANGTHGGGSEYTDGVTTNGTPGSAGAYTKITVPHNAPNTLYYYCTNHPNMGGTINVTTDETKADPYAWKCTLALPFVGNEDDVSHQINCTTTEKSMVINGDAAVDGRSTNFYKQSFLFGGSGGDGVYTADNTDFEFGSGDFTVECWVKQDDTSSYDVFVGKYGGSSDGEFIIGKNGNTPTFLWQDTSGNANINATNFTGNTDVWYHMACVREGNAFTMYINGVCENSTTDSTTIKTTSNKLTVGIENDLSSSAFAGHLSDVRIYKGVAKYSGTTVGTQYFVPPTTNPDILPTTPSGVAVKSKLTQITDGSVGFDGSGDYLTLAQSNDFDLTGDYTCEAFIYYTDTSGNPTIFDFSAVAGNYEGRLQIQAGVLNIYDGGWQSRGAISANTWHHIAVTQAKVFVDGIDVGASSGAISGSNYKKPTIGARTNDGGSSFGDYFAGFISNVRIVNGVELYSEDFRPPTSPLTVDSTFTNSSNVKLLCCQSNTSAGAATVSPQISGLNSGTVWSDYLTTTQGSNSRDFYLSYNYPASNLFDGNTSTIVYGGWIDDTDDASDLIFSPPSGISVSSKLEVYVGYYSLIKVNGSNYNTGGHNTAQGWVTVSDGSNFTGTLTELILENTTNANVVRAAAIRIDDSTILLDPVAKGDSKATTFNPFNTDVNTVRGQESNYCTLNPLSIGPGTAPTLSNGNLKVKANTTIFSTTIGDTFATSGKWYAEVTKLSGQTSDDNIGIGARTYAPLYSGNPYLGRTADSYGFYGDGRTINNDTFTTNYSTSWGQLGDVMGLLMDLDNGTLSLSINGVDQGIAFSGIDASLGWTFAVSPYSNIEYSCNFGQKPFKFSPPDGYQPLNLVNLLPDTVIARPDRFVGVTTYTGNGGTQTINVGLKPDLVWIKDRDGSYHHGLFDTLRGANKLLSSSQTNGQVSYTQSLTSFTSDGFVLGDNSDGNNTVNMTGSGYVGWTWKAGGSAGTFNKDDVGYASASDVGMAIGDQMAAGYNTSQTWSNGLSALSSSSLTNPPNGFNGEPGNYADSTNGWSLDLSGHTFGSGSHPIEVKSGGATSFSVNGTTSLTDPGGGGAKVWYGTHTGEINTITSSASGASVYYVKIDGKILVNTGTNLSGLTQYPSIAPVAASVGTKQGFSIVQYQGNGSANQSIAHGLTQAPDFSIFKNMDGTSNWTIFHRGVTTTNEKVIYLNSSASVADYSGSNTWWYQLPGAEVFYIGDTGTAINNGSDDMISYHWHDVPGLQKFGTFEGNNDANGTYVNLGFKPAIVIGKNIDSSEIWWINDSKRDGYNGDNPRLYPSHHYNEAGDQNIDLLSNGFKLRGTQTNTSNTYIYAAWAESPTVNLYGGQSNAR